MKSILAALVALSFVGGAAFAQDTAEQKAEATATPADKMVKKEEKKEVKHHGHKKVKKEEKKEETTTK